MSSLADGLEWLKVKACSSEEPRIRVGSSRAWSARFSGRDEPHKRHLLAPNCWDADLSIRFPLQAAELHFLVLPKSKLKTTCGVPGSGVKT